MNKTTTDFSWITAKSRHYMSMAKKALDDKRNVMTAIKGIEDNERTFQNTVWTLEFANQQLAAVWSELEFLLNAKPKAVDRAAAKAAVNYLQVQYLELEYDEDIYRALVAVEKKNLKLGPVEKRLFTDLMRTYRRMGFGLHKTKRDSIKKKAQSLAQLASDFHKNINDYKDYILVTREELDGLPESYIAGLKKEGKQYRVSLDYPDYFPFMENAHNATKRKELSHKHLHKGGKQNIVILQKMVKLRDEIAQLLGYKNHAEYVLEVKMAKKPAAVDTFLHGLMRPLRKKLLAEREQLRKLKGQLYPEVKPAVEYYDVAYLTQQAKKRAFNVDDQLVREYFPLEVVTKGLFTIYETLLGVKFRHAGDIPVWHKDVQAFTVHEAKGGELLSYFFLDLYPREGKYGHAAVFPIISGLELPDGTYQKPVAAMLCNFPKPTKDQPSLLSHDEVETYFHEFGHVVHGVLTTAKYGSQSGTSVARDFVEAPSQMLQNWVWNEKTLHLLSGHYRDHKKKLPKSLLQNMLKAKNHMIAHFTTRQLILGMFDMRLHTDRTVKNIAHMYGELVKEYWDIALPKDQIFPAGFGHMDGYDVGYYGYMWSLVYAADMFTRFKKEGLLNPKTGHDYRTHILETGDSEDPMKLVTAFLGRKPNNKAFLKEIGL